MTQALKRGRVLRSAGKLTAGAWILVALVSACVQLRAQTAWVAEAPGPNTKGQVEKIADGEVAGAIRVVAPHPTDERVVYVGAANGGVWKTVNAMDARPHWVPLTDDQKSLSIGALAFDPTDAKHNTLVAGIGRYSSFGRLGGPRTGLLLTTDGGAHWTATDGGGVLNGLNVSGVAPRGSAIVISVDDSDGRDPAKLGLWRFTAADNRWRRITEDVNKRPMEGASFGVVGDPSDPQVLYTNTNDGLYRSADAGATWDKASDSVRDAALETMIAGAGNVRIAVGAARSVYVAVANSFTCGNDTCSTLVGIFRSADGASPWVPMKLPALKEGGITQNNQAATNLSLAADLTDPQVVYIGGDSQSPTSGTEFPLNLKPHPNSLPESPNSIGAANYTGILFRGNASQPPGSQWVHLTHSNTLGAAGGGTKSGSAPHADSRSMAMAANGVLIETDDGGIYRRTDPLTNTGDWFSMNGDIQVTELHSIAYDHNYHVIIGGAQDTGTPQQRLRSDARWQSVFESDGDGGVVAVDTLTPGVSSRYSSSFNLKILRRHIYKLADGSITEESLEPKVVKGKPYRPQFYTPIKVNAVEKDRIIVGAENAVYEGTDNGKKLTEIGRDITVNSITNSFVDSYGSCAIAYGAVGNPHVLYVGSRDRVFVRKSEKSSLNKSTNYTGGYVIGVAINPADADTAYVIDNSHVYRTTNGGGKWTDVTGNLQTLTPGLLHSVAYSTSTNAGSVVVGGGAGVFEAHGPKFTTWTRVGAGLPNAPVYQLEYDPSDRVLIAGTIGRGAWTLPAPPPPAGPLPLAAVRAQAGRGREKKIKERKGSNKRESRASRPFTLRPGLVVDPAGNRAYVMSVEGGVEAVDLTLGKRVWNNTEGARPLGVAGQRLVTQAELPDAENNMRLVVIESLTGKWLAKGAKELPAGVEATVVETPGGEFVAEAQPAGEKAVIVWKFLGLPLRVSRPQIRDTRVQTKKASPSPLPLLKEEVSDTSGAFELNLATGATSAVADPGFIKTLGFDGTLLNDKTASDLPDGQLPSADGRHFLVSKLTGDDRVWDKYTVTVYERDTRRRVGEFMTHFSVTDFFVSGSLVVFETTPYTQTSPAGTVEEPRKLRAVDLATGKEAWSLPVRDTTYRGPFPP